MRLLFRKLSIHDYVPMVVKASINVVNSWPEKVFAEGSIQNLASKIETDTTVVVPVLDLASRTDKRRKEIRSDNSATCSFDVIDVAVPFQGDAVAFDITPAPKIMGARGEVRGSVLILTLMDDAGFQEELSGAIAAIQSNLDGVARGLSTLPKQVKDAVNYAIEKRLTEIELKKNLDPSRSLRIG